METELKKIIVSWLDTASYEGWKTHAELQTIIASGCMKMQTIGWLVADNEEHVIVAQTVGEKQADGILQIPKISITDMFVHNDTDDSEEA